jgi:sterol desaturase/sphingolipid hydroxylase (fatty acid hydroxylase superfamily)
MFLLSMLFHFVSYDLWFYVSHIVLHEHFSKLHNIHHKTPYDKLKWYNTTDGHILENIIQPIGLFIPFLFYVDIQSCCIVGVIISIRGYMRHDDRFSFIVGNHHLIHHKNPNYNFSEYYIDYLFGTLHENIENTYER